VELETEQAKHAKGLLFCDTALITLKIWAELEFGACPASILSLMERNRYDYYLITTNDVNWVQDTQRFNKHGRKLILDLNLKEVKQQPAPFDKVHGLHEDRLKHAVNFVERYLVKHT